jgi:hypothetical protein
MNPADLRRLYRAARAVDTVPGRMEALQARYEHAETVLRAALENHAPHLPHEAIDLPGYHVYIDHDTQRATVARSAITDAAQLAVWREYNQ